MKKSRLKLAVKQAMKPMYEGGFTNTAAKVYNHIMREIDKAYAEKHNKSQTEKED